MCIFCFKELNKWCKSFTKTEICLSFLEAIFVAVLITSLSFLILHLIGCTKRHNEDMTYQNTTSTIDYTSVTLPTTIQHENRTHKPTASKTFLPDETCSWKPSEKTAATTHYYEQNTKYGELNISQTNISEEFPGEFDGELAEENYNSHVLALVKLKPPDVIFACILTIISEVWTLTAASCIDAIEELDSLDYFVMMENYGAERKGRTHALSDVQVHPLYQNGNRSYDLALLKSEDSLTSGAGFPVEMPTIEDYLLMTLGDSLMILGFGPLRTIDKSPAGRRLHKAVVYSVSEKQCRGTEESWSLRHLGVGGAVRAGGCGRGALCAGPGGRAGGQPCNYCAGTPLLSPATPRLLGLMSDNQHCGISCDPQLYVNIAVLKDWIYFIIGK